MAVGSCRRGIEHLPVAAPFPVLAAGANSIVIRLIGPFEFVDRRENSVDPLRNEFDSQEIEIASYHAQPSWPFHGKKRDFRCIGLQECSGAVPLHRCVQSGLWDMVRGYSGAWLATSSLGPKCGNGTSRGDGWSVVNGDETNSCSH